MQDSYRFKSMVVHDKAVLGMLPGSDEYAKEAHLAIFWRQYIFVNHALNDGGCPLIISDPSVTCLPL